jgi:DNA repair exonuclease SbcCD ATPase subunit
MTGSWRPKRLCPLGHTVEYGERCPVCGSRPHHEHTKRELDRAENERMEAEWRARRRWQ